MLSITDLKVGETFVYNNQPHIVVGSEHSKQARGGAIMRTKIKNLITGAIKDKTFKGNENFSEAEIEYKKAEYLYKDNGEYYFMDSNNFEQFSLNSFQIGQNKNYLKDGIKVDIVYFQGKPININLPIKLDFEVTYTEPGFKGDTQSTTFKPAKLETGLEVQVPLFIRIGDIIKLDTRNGKYIERA